MPDVSDHIKERLKALPDKPGVYFHKDEQGQVLYIGKAVNLRNRVRSYFQLGSSKTPKIQRMVGRVAELEWIVTDTELEALILECNMIKRHRPPFNVRLRDDKHYPYLMVTIGEPFPRVLITRKVKRDANRYFGPYTDSSAVYRTTRLIRDVFQIRACDLTFDGKNLIRPCLVLPPRPVLGPVRGLVSPEDYRQQAREVVAFLDGRSKEVVKRLKERMEQAAEDMEFEEAAKLRDQVEAVETISEQQKVLSTKMEEQDVIALAGDDGTACVQMFFIREGKLIGQEQFFLEGTENESVEEQVQHFVAQYYQDAPYVPREVLLPVGLEERDIIESFLRQKKGSKVSVHSPERGDKKRLVEMAGTNADLALKEQMTELKVRLTRAEESMDALQEALNLPDAPRADRVLRHLEHAGQPERRGDGRLRGRRGQEERLPQVQDQDGRRLQRLRLDAGGPGPPAQRGQGRPARLRQAAGPVPDRRRQGTAQRGEGDPGQAPGVDPRGRPRQARGGAIRARRAPARDPGARPQGPAALPAHARRGAPLRHHIPPQAARKGRLPEHPG